MTFKPFFSRKNILILTSLFFLVYLLADGVIIGQHQYQKMQKNKQATARAEEYDKLSPAEKAIRRAESYQAQIITTTHPFERLVFDYLQRTYNLNPKLSVERSPFDIPTKDDQQSIELRYLARIAFPDVIMKELPRQNLEGISLTNVFAANCDNLTLPIDFWPVMQDQYKLGGYNLTHVALAFRFIKDNKCDMPDDAKVIESQVNRGMLAVVNDSATGADLRYEAIAFLLLAGERSGVKQEWVDQIIKEQLPDGGWPAVVDSKRADSHSTLLAMWALLQYSRPDVQYQPLIRHSTN